MIDKLTTDDRRILAHARKWLPYGRFGEDVLVEFGLTLDGYAERLALILDRPAIDLDPADREALRAAIAARVPDLTLSRSASQRTTRAAAKKVAG